MTGKLVARTLSSSGKLKSSFWCLEQKKHAEGEEERQFSGADWDILTPHNFSFAARYQDQSIGVIGVEDAVSQCWAAGPSNVRCSSTRALQVLALLEVARAASRTLALSLWTLKV